MTNEQVWCGTFALGFLLDKSLGSNLITHLSHFNFTIPYYSCSTTKVFFLSRGNITKLATLRSWLVHLYPIHPIYFKEKIISGSVKGTLDSTSPVPVLLSPTELVLNTAACSFGLELPRCTYGISPKTSWFPSPTWRLTTRYSTVQYHDILLCAIFFLVLLFLLFFSFYALFFPVMLSIFYFFSDIFLFFVLFILNSHPRACFVLRFYPT